MPVDFDSIADRPILPEGNADAPTETPDKPIIPDEIEAKPDPEISEDEPEIEVPEELATRPEEKPAEESPPAEVADDAKVKIGGKVYTGKEIKDGILMRADYTKKTQELAARAKEYDETQARDEDREIEVQDFVSRMQDPNEVIREFATSSPAVWEKVQQAIIERFSSMADMTEGELRQFLVNEKHEMERWAMQRDAKVQGLLRDKAEARARKVEFKQVFETARGEVMTEAGLDSGSAEHIELIMDGMTSVRNRGKRWTKELLTNEAARVAKYLNAKPKARQQPTKDKEPEKPKVPPVRAPGARAKPNEGGGGDRKAKKSLSSFFQDLREEG